MNKQACMHSTRITVTHTHVCWFCHVLRSHRHTHTHTCAGFVMAVWERGLNTRRGKSSFFCYVSAPIPVTLLPFCLSLSLSLTHTHTHTHTHMRTHADTHTYTHTHTC